MTYTAEQIIASNKANAQAFEELTTNAYAGFEKLVELNMTTSKTLLGETFSHFQSVLGAKDAQEFLALQAGLLQPTAEKSVAYGRHVYSIATESGAEFTKAVEAKIAEAQTEFGAVVENLAKNAPAGTETAVAAFKSAISASQSAVETAQKSARQAVKAVEANITAATNQAVDVATKVAKKR
ncbi:phasin family protein [Rhodoferax aquaticus]|uniref:Phasin family protein n=1 Tax=Rhodoferax aquaticus TaxID=2527691 RepID=A0A515ES52_9BURK|nr:phasin family protein [Rhodoferax aquaticus]QDL55479.1 phasin family protein [Rhodoferax aquaticus]